jgi:hypothetical protein
MPVFLRSDVEALSPVICEFLDGFEDPLAHDSLRPLDLSGFFDRFFFDGFFIPAFQKIPYFCVSQGSHPEVRQHFWTHGAKYLARMASKNVRKDVYEQFEEDREVLASIITALRESAYAETDILKIAVFQVKSYVERHKGELSGQVFFDSARKLPECWRRRILENIM